MSETRASDARPHHLIMTRLPAAIACLTLALPCQAQGPNLAAILNFETDHPGGSPGGWGSYPAGSVFADDKIVHGGRWSARIERPAGSAGSLSGITKSIPMDCSGNTPTLSASLS